MDATVRAKLLALPALVLACTACGGGTDAGVDATEAIEQFDPSPRNRLRSLARISIARTIAPSATREAALQLLDAESPATRLGAVYALGLTLERDDADELTGFLGSANAPERILGATAMVSAGDKRGIPVLITALSDDAALPAGDPPLRAWQQARFVLLSFTDRDFGLRQAEDLTAAREAQAKWKRWWATAGRSYRLLRPPWGLP